MTLKRTILRCWSILFYPRYWSQGKSIIFLTRVTGTKNNIITLEKGLVKKSSILFSGRNNVIDLKKAEMCNCHIFLRGQGHQLSIEEGVQLHDTRIRIIGERNRVHIGKNTTIGNGNLVSGGKGISIQIGHDCMIAEGVDIWSTDTHSVLQDGQLVNEPKSIIIGDHVWIGKDVAILKGVTIGDNAVVGMRSMVTKDVPPATLSVGSPARVIREGIDWNRYNPNNE